MKIAKILSAMTAAVTLAALAGCSSKKQTESSETDPLAPKTAPQNVTFDWQEPFETIIQFRFQDQKPESPPLWWRLPKDKRPQSFPEELL